MSTRLFGFSPAAVVRAGPKGWAHSYRDFCDVSSSFEGTSQATIRFTDIHPPVLQVPAYAICAAALFRGAADFAGGATIELTEDVAACSWDLQLQW